MTLPHTLLRESTQRLTSWLDADGELRDTVFGEPTQYGTAYFAYCNAALAELGGPDRDTYLDLAELGLAAALDYVCRAHDRETGSGFARDTGTISRVTHRDFCWPPILRPTSF